MTMTDERLAELDAALETIGLPICPEWTYSAIRHCQRNMDLDVGDGFNEPDRQCGGSIAEIVNAYPDLRAHIDAQAATIARVIGAAKSLLALCEQAGLADDLLAAVFPDSKNRSGQTRDETAKQARRTMNEARAALGAASLRAIAWSMTDD